MKKFALVLSGGGFKGAFQLGALKYLKENWHQIDPGASEMKFDIVAGVSVGSLNGYMVAADQFENLEELWKKVGENGVSEIYTSDFIDTSAPSDHIKMKFNLEKFIRRFMPTIFSRLSFWKGLGAIFSPKKFFKKLLSEAQQELSGNLKNFKSIADNSPLEAQLASMVKKSAIRDTIYKCGFVSLDDGQYYCFRHTDFNTDEDLKNGILASSTMPIVWRPVSGINAAGMQVRNSVDGGIRNVSPLGDVIDEINKDESGAEYTIIVINCGSGAVDRSSFDDANIAQIAMRSLTDITLCEIFDNDLKEFMRINDLLEQADTLYPGLTLYNYDYRKQRRSKMPLRPFNTIVIQPADGELGDTLTANKELVEKRMAHGAQKAEQALQEKMELV